MEPVIHSSYGPLELQLVLPGDWSGHILSGGQAYSYEGDLGKVTIQNFYDQKFSICYAVTDFLRKVKLFWTEQPLVRLQYVLDGKLRYKDKTNRLIKLAAGQLNAVWQPGRETEAQFQKGRFEIFQFALHPQLVQELIPQFPREKSFPSEKTKQWIGERQKDIYEILNARYNDSARRFFYETKIREHLFAFIQPLTSNTNDSYTEEEKERIFSVDRKILKDLTRHHSTEDLAHFAKMSEGKLITAFKEIIGVSMFERYKEAKLQKAKKYLLETDIQIKALFEIVGYESYSGFIEAFTERFGLSPRRFRKKYRPFD